MGPEHSRRHRSSSVAPSPSAERSWELMYKDERDKHTARLIALTHLREQVGYAIKDLSRRDTAAALDRLRRARARSVQLQSADAARKHGKQVANSHNN